MGKFTLPKDGGLIEAGLPNGIKHSYERIPSHIFEDEEVACTVLAERIAAFINAKDGVFRLGLTTGSSPVTLYRKLVGLYEAGKVSFNNVEVYSIDEYYPAPADSQSRNRRLYEEFVSKVDLKPGAFHAPKITEYKDSDTVTEFCSEYDRMASGLDLLVMGIGEKGQIGFNEAGATEFSRTRTVHLSYVSKKRQAKNFGGNMDETPESAIALGISTMLSAGKIYLIGWGEDKAQVVKNVVEEPINPSCPASYLQKHSNISFYMDDNAASLLTRNVAPWLVGPSPLRLCHRAAPPQSPDSHRPVVRLPGRCGHCRR
jgi:glucosamine-6-phosphate deaminase